MRWSRRFLLILLALTLLAATLPARARAQAQPQMIVLQTVPHAEADDQQLGLDIYFSLRQGDGTPITLGDADLADLGEIRLLNGSQNISLAQISPATGPIRIALVIDASGSMLSSIDAVREAAKKAINQAPDSALIAVYAFHKLDVEQPLLPIQDYTQNHQLATQALDAIAPREGNPTCLYNAAFSATTQLSQAAAQTDRRAIILFTDGKDDNGNGGPCSQRSVENVISGALDVSTPIYTIGLCKSPACANLNADVLSEIADKTRAISRYGVLDEMEGLFGTVMDQINAQWLAQARVAAIQGENSATLTIPRSNQQTPLVGSLAFDSPRDFYAVPSFQLRARYLADQDVYELKIEARNTQSLQDVQIEAWAENSIVAEMAVPAAELDQPITFPTNDLAVGQKYNFLLRATDMSGQPFSALPPIVRNDPEVLAQSGELAAYRPAFSFTIETVSTDWKHKELQIKLAIENAPGTSAPIFSGYVSASDGEVLRFDPLVPDRDNQLIIDLADERAFRRAASDHKPLHLIVSPENKPGAESSEREFTPPSPPFEAMPWLIGTTVALLIALVFWFILRRGKKLRREARGTKRDYDPHDPPSGPIGRVQSPPSAKKAAEESPSDNTLPVLRPLQIMLIRPPERAQQTQRKWTVSESQTIVGRLATNRVSIVDQGVSKTHLQIDMDGHAAWTITDLNSSNGTFVGFAGENGTVPEATWKKLTPKQAYPISNGIRVRLGEDTEIELRIG
ncbi:FHA domain-containing protein [Oscillochloris sp. ZM17-4]|uniref:FHA domain-containing protein n=1 Tax=Oscillochloris sp. ZM17-4 TaxID=2866714 RepID=UPI001C72CD2A|nr:FHA domain-containing protein [Oscillochloris sp. ZM17-4]MBX0329894.1 FHA domain-containing protein [Oscillochloris sp. ZM17-4]